MASVLDVLRERQHIPFLDIAYQGFAEGIYEDAAAVRLFAESDMPFFVSSSFSKSFSLYGERVGALSIVTESKEQAARVLSQLKRVIRTNYSNPPTHGATVVGHVLNTPELNTLWQQELGQMRERILLMRKLMVEQLAAKGAKRDFSFVTRSAACSLTQVSAKHRLNACVMSLLFMRSIQVASALRH